MNDLKLPRRSQTSPVPAEGLKQMASRFPESVLKQTVTSAAETYGVIRDGCTRIQKDTTLTDGARLVRSANFARTKATAVANKLAEARALAEGHKQSLLSEMAAPYNTRDMSFAEVALAGEVRTMLRQSSGPDRVKLLMDAVSQKDIAILTAVGGAPAALSGIAEQHHTLARDTVTDTLYPEQKAQLDTLDETLQLTERFESALMQGVADSVDFATASELERAAAVE